MKLAQNLIGLALLLLTGWVSADSPLVDAQHRIQVKVFGATEGRGSIILSLFDSPDTYMRESLTSSSVEVDNKGNAFIDMGAHPPGDYAVAVVYDENDNGSLDTGFLNIPTEKVGFSNNVSARFGPPKWRKARFTVADEDVRLDVYLGRKKPSDYKY